MKKVIFVILLVMLCSIAFAKIGDSLSDFNPEIFPMNYFSDNELNKNEINNPNLSKFDMKKEFETYLNELAPKTDQKEWASGECIGSKVNASYYYQCLLERQRSKGSACS